METPFDSKIIENVTKNEETSLTRAKKYWFSKPELSRLSGVQISLAPHTVQIMECCSLAVDKYCVVIGTAKEEIPENESVHIIKELPDHPEFYNTIDVIRSFLKELSLRKIYTLYIEEPMNAGNKISLPTVLIAIWKLICSFEEQLDKEMKLKDTMRSVFEKYNISVLDGEIDAVLNGSRWNGYLNGFISDAYHSGGRQQTEVETVESNKLFMAHDLIFIRTNLSNANDSRDRYFKPGTQRTVRDAFLYGSDDPGNISCGDSDDDDSDQGFEDVHPKDPWFIGSQMMTYSKSRLGNSRFQGCEYEKQYQAVFEDIIKADGFSAVQGGEVQRDGILLVVLNGFFNRNYFIQSITESFKNKQVHPQFIIFENLRQADAVHLATNSAQDMPFIPTIITVTPANNAIEEAGAPSTSNVQND